MLPIRLHELVSALERDPHDLAVRLDAAREACAAGEWSTARELVETGLQRYPASGDLLALSGSLYLHARRYHDAEYQLAAALVHGAAGPEVHYTLALARFKQTHYARALNALHEAPWLRDSSQALLLGARCLHRLGRLEEAIADCRACILASPCSAEGHGLLGLLLHETRRDEEAQMHIDVALRFDGGQHEATLAQAELLQEAGAYGAAHALFHRLLAQQPASGHIWLGRAVAALCSLQLESAAEAIERATVLLPQSVDAWHALAWIELARDEIEAAEIALFRAHTLDPNCAETHGGFAVIAALQGRDEDAWASISRAERLDSDGVCLEYARLILLECAGAHAQVRAGFERLLARPVAGGGGRLRDFVRSHVAALQMRGAGVSTAIVRH